MKTTTKELKSFLNNIKEHTPAAGGIFYPTLVGMGKTLTICYPSMGGVKIEYSQPIEGNEIGTCPLAPHEWERFIDIVTRNQSVTLERDGAKFTVNGKQLSLADKQTICSPVGWQWQDCQCDMTLQMSDINALSHFGQEIDFYVNAPVVFACGVCRDVIQHHALCASVRGAAKFNIPTSFLRTIKVTSDALHMGDVKIAKLLISDEFVAVAEVETHNQGKIKFQIETVEPKFQGFASARIELDQATKLRYAWQLNSLELSGVLLRILTKLPQEPKFEECLLTLKFAGTSLKIQYAGGEETLKVKGRGRGEITVDISSLFMSLSAIVSSQPDVWLYPRPPKNLAEGIEINCLVIEGWGTLTYVGGIIPVSDTITLPLSPHSYPKPTEQVVVDWGDFKIVQSQYVKNRPTLGEALMAQEQAMAVMPVDEYDYEGRTAIIELEKSHQALLRAWDESKQLEAISDDQTRRDCNHAVSSLVVECDQILSDPYLGHCNEDVAKMIEQAHCVTRAIESYTRYTPKMVRTEFRYQGMKVNFF